MKPAESLRKTLNKRQTELRRVMMAFDQHEEAMQMFLEQHAALHSAMVAQPETGSLADLILDDLTEEQFRRIPPKGEHSIVWCIWHLARIEDAAMNILVAGGEQVIDQDDWVTRLKSPIFHTGNNMDDDAMQKLSDEVDIEAMRAYRIAVGRRTRQIAAPLTAEQLQQKVDPARLQRVMDEGALIEKARGIADYWGKRTIAGLLLMPASRHLLTHLNEAIGIKKKVM